ncbi:MAG: hypothetical protein ACYCU8_11225 [Ferrimicrobium acidiphilum]
MVTIRPMQLNEAEETVWNDAREGKQTIITEKQVVRAEFIEGLLLGEELTRKGLHIRRARITGELDFNDGQIRVPINLEACEFEKAPNFERASLWSLSLSGSSMPALNLYEIQVKHDVDLSGAKVTGKVRLVRATIGGNLNCERASFKNDKGTALSMDGAKIGGDLLMNHLNESTEAPAPGEGEGEVRLVRATIGGDLNCEQATFKNDKGKGTALSMDGAKIGGSVSLKNVKATGSILLPGATIGGDLNCARATFKNDKGTGTALSMDGAKIGGDLLMNHLNHLNRSTEATATGEVRLVRATIGGDLNCEQATFKNDKGTALSMDGAAIVGTVVLPLLALEDVSALEDAETLGTFDLRGMECAQLKFITDDTGSSTQELSTRVLLLGAKFSEVEVVSDETAGKRASSHSVRHRITGSYHLNSPGGKVIRRLLLAQQSDSAPSEGRDTGGRGEIYPTIYDYTARVLRDTGKEQLADQILIEKYRQLRRQRPWYLRLSGLLSDLTIGYGYRPSLILIWVLAVYVLSVVVLSLALSHNGIVATPLSSSRYVPSPLVHSDSYPVFSPWNYAFGSLLIPFVHLPGVDAWRANAANGWGVAVRVIKWVEPVVLWVLIVILGANSTRIISRDR